MNSPFWSHPERRTIAAVVQRRYSTDPSRFPAKLPPIPVKVAAHSDLHPKNGNFPPESTATLLRNRQQLSIGTAGNFAPEYAAKGASMENPFATPVFGPKRALFYSHDTLSKILPNYPEEARFARLESVFRAAFIVTREGRVDPTRFVLLECLHPIFAREAMGAIIEGWEFEPVRIDGSPKEMYSTAGVRFILRR